MNTWPNRLTTRLRDFERSRGLGPSPRTLSMKFRVTSGCFHREHSPEAYRLIDSRLAILAKRADRPDWLEHENGPELLVHAAVVTAGLTLVKSVVDLVVTVLKARSEGIKKGDRPAEPLEVIVRRSSDGSRVDEEIILRVRHTDAVHASDVERRLIEAMTRLQDQADRPPPAS